MMNCLKRLYLFAAIGATDEQLDFPHIYASGRNGWATLDLNQPNDNQIGRAHV